MAVFAFRPAKGHGKRRAICEVIFFPAQIHRYLLHFQPDCSFCRAVFSSAPGMFFPVVSGRLAPGATCNHRLAHCGRARSRRECLYSVYGLFCILGLAFLILVTELQRPMPLCTWQVRHQVDLPWQVCSVVSWRQPMGVEQALSAREAGRPGACGLVLLTRRWGNRPALAAGLITRWIHRSPACASCRGKAVLAKPARGADPARIGESPVMLAQFSH